MRPTRWIPAPLLAASLFAPHVLAQPGALDPTFGDGGVVLIEEASVESLALNSQGRVVAWGESASSGSLVPTLWRFGTDGSLDPTFGDGGSVAVAIGCGNCFTGVTEVAVLRSDAIVAADYYVNDLFEEHGRWQLISDDGTLETTVYGRRAVAIVTRPDGRFIVLGRNDPVYDPISCEVLQFRSGGFLDPTFGDGGAVDLARVCVSASVLDDGVLVTFRHSLDESWGAVRLLEDGRLDRTFGDGGVALVGIDGGLTAGAVSEDGSLVLMGPDFLGYPTLARLTSDGSLDPAFGDGGVVTLEAVGRAGISDGVSGPGGATAFTGSFYDSPRTLAARVLADGSLDPAFGAVGVVALDYPVSGRSIALDTGGGIVVGGRRGDSGFIARLLNDAVVATEPSVQPERLALSSPARNPASERVSFAYTLAEPSTVRLAVYDVLGREVAVLAEGTRPAGPHEATLDASRLAPGLYVARLTAGDAVATRRLTVVR